MKKPKTLALSAIFLLTTALPGQAQFVNLRQSGVPTYIFRSGSGLTPGQEVTFTLDVQERNISVGTPNACGYKIISPGSSATGINSIHPGGGTIINTATLPTFDGRCSTTATGSVLVPATEGAAIPTSHYKQPDGKIALKVDPLWTYLTVNYANVTRKAKVGRCGEVRYSPQAARDGQRQPFVGGIINIPGVASNVDLEDVLQNNQDAICSQRWTYGTDGSIEKQPRFFSMP